MEPSLFLSRELGTSQLRSPCHMPEGIARKLALETVLHGHDGCVNRLAWNEDGSMLASASDDCQVMLWHYPDTGRVPLALQTQHRANLFGVAFLPQHNNTKVISGAMDYTVQMHELEGGAFQISPKYRSSSSSSSNGVAAAAARRQGQQQRVHHIVPWTTVYQCHKSRVKEVEVCQSEPTMFWSAGEDGIIRQYDLRVPDQKAYGSPNVLINLTAAGPHQQLVECKGVDVNHLQPHLMAVACGDPYVRVFDRRKLATSRPGGRPSQPLLQLTCPHLPLLLKAGINRRAHTTHVSFSNRGDKLVTSYHGDHAYIFDVTGAAEGAPIALCGQQQQQRSRSGSRSPRFPINDQQVRSGNIGLPSGDQITQITAADKTLDQGAADLAAICNLPETAEASKVSGNNALFEQRYSAAVADFTAAIAAAPCAAGLYAQRALAYLNRGWEGDAAYALRDCDMALDLVGQQPGAAAAAAEQQARLRQVHALKQLGQCQCAAAALDTYNRIYPQAVDNTEITGLQKQLEKQIEQRQTYKMKLRLQRQQMRERQLQQWQQRQQQQRSAAAARERYGLPQQQDPAMAAEQELQQQQQQSGGQVDPAAAAAAAADRSGSNSSRDISPIGAPVLRSPPGPGVRVDTDLDSEDLEDDQSLAAAAAPAGEAEMLPAPPPLPQQQQQEGYDCSTDGLSAAAAAAVEMDVDNGTAAAADREQEEGFIGPVLPPHMRRLQQQQQAASHLPGSSNGTQQQQPPHASTAAAAAAAVARGRAVSQRIGAAEAAASAANSDHEIHSVNGGGSDRLDSEDDRELDHELQWLNSDIHSESEDELLRPWFGPSTHAQDQITAAADQQQQQQLNGSSSSKCRPRSSSDTGIHLNGDLNSAAAATRARHTNGYNSCSSSQNHKSNSYTTRCNSPNSTSDWWDSLSGGPGRLLQRCMGHCNVQTDIKEAVFLGERDELVACGSDDGCVFIYSAATGECVRTLPADDDVANCVRCHPSLPVLATSGIDSVVRLWSPTAQPDYSSPTAHVNANQSRMRDGPRLLRGAAIPPAALQAALDENPQLLQMLVQQLYGIGSGTAAAAAARPAAAAAVAAAAAEGEGLARGGDQGIGGFEFELQRPDNSGSGSDGEGGEGGGRRRRRAHGEVACRVS